MLTFETDLAQERARARALGVNLTVDSDDRDPVRAADRRGPNACPTCEDGVRTITSPQRCRQCIVDGL